MFYKKSLLLFCSIASILFTGCGKSDSYKVIEEPLCLTFAACVADPQWVATELYDYAIECGKSDHQNGYYFAEMSLYENGMKNNLKEEDLIDFLFLDDAPTIEDYPRMNKKNFSSFNKDRAFNLLYKLCNGDFVSFILKINEKVEIYDYRKDKDSSTNRITVYDVVYRVKGKTYVLCSVSDLGESKFYISYKDSSTEYLGF